MVKMVKSESNKVHLEIKTVVELDVNNASISRRNRKSKKSSSSTVKRIKKVSNKLKTPDDDLKQAKLMSAKDKDGKRSTVSSGPIDKVKKFWENLTSSSDSKDTEKAAAAAAESEDKRIRIKVWARKEPVTNKESPETASSYDSDGSSAGSGASPASDESQTIYMPIKQTSDGKTSEAIIIKRKR